MNPMRSNKRLTGLLVLAAIMLVARLFHFQYPPDASWAVFLLSGFYGYRLRAFALLLLEAVVIDYVTAAHMGMSSYCLSAAYAFVPPAYAVLWLGGCAAARHWQPSHWQRVAWLAATVLVSVTLCFLLTNGGWMNGVARWYPYFLVVPAAYIGLAVLAQQVTARLNQAPAVTNRRAT